MIFETTTRLRSTNQHAGSADQHPWGLQSLRSSSKPILLGQSFGLNSLESGQESKSYGSE